MARRPKPWFRSETGWWMVQLGGRQHKLAQGKPNKAKAYERFHELCLMLAEPAEASDARAVDVCEEFLNWSQHHQAKATYLGYLFYVQAFCEGCGFVRVSELKPFHVTRWLRTKAWNDTTQYNALRSVFRVFNWAKTQGLLRENPLRGMERPRPKNRERCLTDDEYRKLLAGSHGAFRLVVFAMRQTGARPGEIRQLKWEMVHADRWVLGEHKTVRKTRKPRVIHLTPPMVRLMEFLRSRRESDFVFLNKRRKPWTSNAIRLQVQRIREKTGMADDVCAYLLRHTFGTKAVLNGVDLATVAELMGHVDTKMVSTVYVHLADQTTHLASAAAKAVTAALGTKPPQKSVHSP